MSQYVVLNGIQTNCFTRYEMATLVNKEKIDIVEATLQI